MAMLLLFNISTPEKKSAIRLTAMRLGISCREVLPEQQGQTLESLLAGSLSSLPASADPFTDEMLVMDALSSDDFRFLLDTLRENDQRVRLKAVVTEHNRFWSAERLYRELSAEAEAMEKRRATIHAGSKKKGRR